MINTVLYFHRKQNRILFLNTIETRIPKPQSVQGELVKQVLSHAILRGSQSLQVGDVIAKLLDHLHLFIQVVSLQEVTQLERKDRRN